MNLGVKGIGRGALSHHIKELTIRTFFSFMIGKGIGIFLYGFPEKSKLIYKKIEQA